MTTLGRPVRAQGGVWRHEVAKPRLVGWPILRCRDAVRMRLSALRRVV